MAKVWANGLVILVADRRLAVPGRPDGCWTCRSPARSSLWFVGVVLYLFFATALGIFLGTISRSMAQFALLIILVIIVLQLLSGGSTPVESQPKWLQYADLLPARRGTSSASRRSSSTAAAGSSAVWPQFLMVAAIGLAFFVYSLGLFRKSIAVTK